MKVRGNLYSGALLPAPIDLMLGTQERPFRECRRRILARMLTRITPFGVRSKNEYRPYVGWVKFQ